jgi:hypothetical protein
MVFEQCEGQSRSLKITKRGFGKCGNFKYLGKTLTNQYCKHEELDQIKFRERLLIFNAKYFVFCFDI